MAEKSITTNKFIEFDNYIIKLSNITGYEVESLKDLVARSRAMPTQEGVNTAVKDFHPERKILRKLEYAERELLYQMANNPDAVKFYEDRVNGFYDETYRQIANYLVEFAQNHKEFNEASIITSIQMSELDNKDELVQELTNLYVEKKHPQQCNDELLVNLLESINDEKNRIFIEMIFIRSAESGNHKSEITPEKAPSRAPLSVVGVRSAFISRQGSEQGVVKSLLRNCGILFRAERVERGHCTVDGFHPPCPQHGVEDGDVAETDNPFGISGQKALVQGSHGMH